MKTKRSDEGHAVKDSVTGEHSSEPEMIKQRALSNLSPNWGWTFLAHLLHKVRVCPDDALIYIK